MSGRLKIYLKANERFYINGAVIKVDRKVSIELLNDVVFLLDSQVIQEEQANTPLRRLYFVVQSMLIDPATTPLAMRVYADTHTLLLATFKDQDVLEGLVDVRNLIERRRIFDALKRIRSLLPLEEKLIQSGALPEQIDKAVA